VCILAQASAYTYARVAPCPVDGKPERQWPGIDVVIGLNFTGMGSGLRAALERQALMRTRQWIHYA